MYWWEETESNLSDETEWIPVVAALTDQTLENEKEMVKTPSVPREHQKVTQSSMSDIQKASSSEKKGPRSEYDFPDSPDDERPIVKGSYKVLSGSTRSPRRGVVDSSNASCQNDKMLDLTSFLLLR
jgi:hypothetical protein